MKKVIDYKGTFQISIPPTWKYWVMEKDIHSFEENDNVGDSNCFQFSISPLTEDEKKKLVDLLGVSPADSNG
jgi:hypothetical protein